jgi:hypothetical protein
VPLVRVRRVPGGEGEAVRRVLLVAVLCAGCAVGSITRPDGTRVAGIVIGAAALETCDRGGMIGPSSGSADGALLGGCSRIDGGTLSGTFATLIGAALTAVGAYFSAGALW